MKIGDLFWEMRAESTQLKRDAQQAGDAAGTAASKSFSQKVSAGFKAAFDNARKDFSKNLGQGFVQGLGIAGALNATNLVTKGIGMMTDAIGTSIDAASDLNESMSKVNVVFGESAEEIVKWSETSASSVLMSQQAALEAAGTFGNLFDALGLASEAQVTMSKGAVQLAADLASFNNAPVEETLLAIRSGLLGEAEPMRKFGSALTAARVEAFALAKGWVRNKKDLTEAMKVQARYEIIMQDTALAQGDVARTGEGLANQSRELDANMTNLAATIGGFIIGPANLLVGFFNDLLGALDGPEGATGALARMQAQVEKTGTAIEQAAAGPVRTFAEEVTALEQAGRSAALGGIFGGGQGNPEMAKWIEGYTFVGKMLGNTPEQLVQVAKSYQAAGKTMDEFRADLIKNLELFGPEVLAKTLGIPLEEVNELIAGRLAAGAPNLQAALTDLWGQVIEGSLKESIARGKAEQAFAQMFSWGWWNQAKETAEEIPDTLGKLPKAAQAMWVDTNKAFQGLKGSYTQAVKDAERFDKAWRFALANPDKGEKTANQIRDNMKTAMRRRNRALREGNEEAFAIADAEVKRLQKKLDSLEQREYEIKIQMRILGYEQAKTKIRGITHSDLLNITDDRPAPRHTGGRATRGMPYIVGEKRPELFVPDSNGTILPRVPGGRMDIYVHDPDGGLARAGIGTAALGARIGATIASDTDAQSRWEDAF
jgi:hypothetical protein